MSSHPGSAWPWGLLRARHVRVPAFALCLVRLRERPRARPGEHAWLWKPGNVRWYVRIHFIYEYRVPISRPSLQLAQIFLRRSCCRILHSE